MNLDLETKRKNFNKQREQMQQKLMGMAEDRPTSCSRMKYVEKNIANLNFTDDRDKMQNILKVRNKPAMSQVKIVKDLLRERREAMLPEEINSLCFVDLNNKEVFENLKSSSKVSFDGARFSYKPTHLINNKAELLRFLRKAPDGTLMSEIEDAYLGVVEDANELKETGDIRIICNSETKEEVLYPDDLKEGISIDEDIKNLIRGVTLPKDFLTIEKELKLIGITPKTNLAQQQERVFHVPQREQKKPKKRSSKRIKYTNSHLPGLFENPNEK